MSEKKKAVQVIEKTYGTSWIFTIILALICGVVGFLIGNPSGLGLQGFIVGAVMPIFCEILTLASFIPYVGIYCQWVWSLMLNHWVIGLAGFSSTSPINTLLYFPLILFTIFGAIIYLVVTGIVTVIIGALIGAIFG